MRSIHKDYTSWCGKECIVERERTIAELTRLAEDIDEDNAYSEAVDLLGNEQELSLRDTDYWERYGQLRDKLMQNVKNTVGYVNFGFYLTDGQGGVSWRKMDKETSIRWAMADFIKI